MDLITHQVCLKDGTPIYNAKQRRFVNDKEWWMRKIILEGIDAGMYKRTSSANDRMSPWNAAPVLVAKPGQEQPHLTFNYPNAKLGNWRRLA